jgi:NAD+ kinase
MPEDWVLASVQKENIASFMQFVIDRKYTISKRTLLSLTCTPLMSPSMQLILLWMKLRLAERYHLDDNNWYVFKRGVSEFVLGWRTNYFNPNRIYRILSKLRRSYFDPRCKSLVITPIAPHNLTARPLVVPDETEIRLKVSGRDEYYLVSILELHLLETSQFNWKLLFKLIWSKFPRNLLKTLRKLLWGEDKRN